MLQLHLPHGTVPATADLAGLLLERQTLDHTEADYRAVMASREHLRAWSGSPWPEDGFTLEDNRADLAGHIEEAQAGFSYGYTVFTPASEGGDVQGSVYFYPAAFFAGRYGMTPSERATMDTVPVAIDYWLRPARERAAQHASFVRALAQWARTAWGYERAAFMSRPAMVGRRALLDRLGAVSAIHAESLHARGWWQWFQILECGQQTP